MNVEEAVQNDVQSTYETLVCFHCGEDCPDQSIEFDEKFFCCHGCESVYQLLNQTGLCSYYDLNEHAGINRRSFERSNKFSFLEDNDIQQSLIHFKQGSEVHITFYIPQIHCSSCVYLLENLHVLEEGIIRSDIQFLKREVHIIFDDKKIKLKNVVERLASIGYEPHISLNQLEKKKPKVQKSLIYRLGVAGFCFGNIMLLSFPEYFSHNVANEAYLGDLFKYLNVLLSLPVFFYSSSVFFTSAWKGIKHKHLNIDSGIALAILVTFVRSLIEVFVYGNPGYFDSMAGIVFYMLVGRVLQDKTYGQLSFERDYTDYFPIAATVIKDGKEVPTALPELKINDTLRIHNNELIPADGILIRGKAQIDYSFVTGESAPVDVEMGEIIYAGGKQMGGVVELLTVKEVAQSYLTGLWNKENVHNIEKEEVEKRSFVHALGRNFTWIVLSIAISAGIFWWSQGDSMKAWTSITAVLIIACPCALLLTSTFTNGYIMRILGKNGLFLRNAHMIESFGKLNHLVFDKTGTITSTDQISASYFGSGLSADEENWLASLTIPTTHALSKPIRSLFSDATIFPVENFKDYPGLGVSGTVAGHLLKIGTASFMEKENEDIQEQGTALFLQIDGIDKGGFILRQGLRKGVHSLFKNIQNKLKSSLISGDKPYQKNYFKEQLGSQMTLRFQQKPEDKLNYIKELQSNDEFVGMIGDGLNDAGALKQSDVGICIAEDTNNFTPAGDAILEGKKLKFLDRLILLCKKSKNIIRVSFAFSILYNLIGIYFAVQGLLSPLIAAILMPCSTLTIVLITYISSRVIAKRIGLES